MISAPLWESSAPVGSSARRICGLIDQGTRNGYPLLLPARELSGKVELPAGQADVGQSALAQFVSVGCFTVLVEQWQFDILQRIHSGKQVEILKDEPDLLIPNLGKLVAIHGFDRNAVQQITA